MRKTFKVMILVMLAVCSLGLGFVAGCGCKANNNTTVLSRQATINDISIDTSQELSINMTYSMIPKTDITGLELKFVFYDKNNKIVTSKTKEVGDVNDGMQYSVKISFFEFSFTELLKITSTQVSVTKGTVSLL